MRKGISQRGETEFVSLIGITIVCGFCLFFIYLNMEANPSEVEVVYGSAKSSLAKEAVRLFLTEHPYPKKKDIKSLQIEIEEMNDDENF